MPKLTTSVPKYRKHRASGQAIVTINGRDHYLGPHNSKASKVQYDQLVNQWLASHRNPSFGLPQEQIDEPSLSDLMNAYRKWAIKYYRHPDGKPTGTADNIAPLMRRLRQWYGKLPLSEFTPLAFKDVIKRLINEGLSITTVNDYIARVKHMFRWGVSEELVGEPLQRRLDTVSSEHQGRSEAKPKRIIYAIADDIVEETIPRMPVIVQSMVQLQRLTGMRPAEVCQIRPCDITRKDDMWLYSPYQHKTQHHGKTRTIVLGAKARELLKPFMDGEPELFCFNPRRSREIQLAKKSAARVVPLSCGNKPKKRRKLNGGPCYDVHSYRRAIHRACDLAFKPANKLAGDDLKKWQSAHRWSPNQLRHALAEQVQGIGDIEAVAAVLGHSKIDTSKIYAKHNLKLAIDTMRQIG
jgi:integrase